MKRLFVSIFLLVVIVQQPGSLQARDLKEGDDSHEDYFMDSFPVPAGIPNQLFYLQRTPNTNTIVYELNLVNGKINPEEPIHVFWIRYPEGGIYKELNYIQKHFAYGVDADLMNDGRYKLTFAAYKKRNFYLAYAPRDSKYHVYGLVGNKMSMLIRVFIQINPGGTFWAPNVQYIDIKGREIGTGKEVTERIMIKKPS
jgi:hypothetical protein